MSRSTSSAARRAGAVLDAALDEVVENGWAGLVPARVAARAGSSVTPVRTMFGGRPGMAVGLWDNRLGDVIARHLQPLPSDVLNAGEASIAGTLADVLEPFVRPDPHMHAAIELLVASAYEPTLTAAVRATIGAHLDPTLLASVPSHTQSRAAQQATLFATALGLGITARITSPSRLDLAGEYEVLAHALANPSRPVRLTSEELDFGFSFDTGDPITDELLMATLETVGEIGYDNATVERIAQRSRYSQGAIFSRYSTKADLFLDATQRFTAYAGQRNAATLDRIASTRSPGIAEALYLRDSMRPANHPQRVVILEQFRLARFDEQIAAAINNAVAPMRAAFEVEHHGQPDRAKAALHMAIARGQGPSLLAAISPTTWSLPYDVVTVPYSGA